MGADVHMAKDEPSLSLSLSRAGAKRDDLFFGFVLSSRLFCRHGPILAIDIISFVSRYVRARLLFSSRPE